MVVLFCSLSTGCLVSSDEVTRAASPDHLLDAVVIETNGGATTAFGYEIYIVPHNASAWRGKHVASLYGAVRNENAWGTNAHWLAQDDLAIEYLKAEDVSLIANAAQIGGHHVKIALRPGILDTTAPAGGMLYNLQRRRPPVPQ